MKSKKYLLEARELVGPGGLCPLASEEQDVVLELGNLWYNRYITCDEKVSNGPWEYEVLVRTVVVVGDVVFFFI